MFLTRDPDLASRAQRLIGGLALLAFFVLLGFVPR